MKVKSEIMNARAIEHTMKRMAYEIIERNKGLRNVHLVGIKSRGVPMARRLAGFIGEIEQTEVPVGILDISLYRDDLSLIAQQPVINGSQINFNVDKAIVVLVDDVLYTGRTVRAAIDGLLSFGRPCLIQLCVLIDRGHHEMPVKADFLGNYVPTSPSEIIKVSFKETDKEDSVKIMIRKGDS
ncbi:MAG: bifunctional pyr operon transcriptional regulator/uracil phosphoribosyltransferase PyrR [Candidatus Cloacimonetes bacterium]|nr:bifunctional pyr operon transcriptional regulator/uracil phosphoribosyltransferase PyrR [Candidatus Cloacimonadota bacterium]